MREQLDSDWEITSTSTDCSSITGSLNSFHCFQKLEDPDREEHSVVNTNIRPCEPTTLAGAPQSFPLGGFLVPPLSDDSLRLHPGVRVPVLPWRLVLQLLLDITETRREWPLVWPDWLPPANLLYFGFESGLVLEVLSPLFVDFLHLRLDVGQHGVTVVTPGTQYRDNVADISFPASLMILAGYQYCARSNLCNYLISLPMT